MLHAAAVVAFVHAWTDEIKNKKFCYTFLSEAAKSNYWIRLWSAVEVFVNLVFDYILAFMVNIKLD